MTSEKTETQPTAGEPTKAKSDFLKKFEMAESHDTEENEHEDHVHVEGCCSCHSNIGE